MHRFVESAHLILQYLSHWTIWNLVLFGGFKAKIDDMLQTWSAHMLHRKRAPCWVAKLCVRIYRKHVNHLTCHLPSRPMCNISIIAFTWLYASSPLIALMPNGPQLHSTKQEQPPHLTLSHAGLISRYHLLWSFSCLVNSAHSLNVCTRQKVFKTHWFATGY